MAKTAEERKKEKHDYLVDKYMKDIPFTGATPDQLAVRAAYKQWLDAAVDRYGGKLTDAAVKNCVLQVNSLARNNYIAARDIILMNTNGYNTMEYAMNAYLEKPQLRPSVMEAKANQAEWTPNTKVVF